MKNVLGFIECFRMFFFHVRLTSGVLPEGSALY